MSNAPSEETVLSVEHYTDRLFKFTCTRPTSFRFRSGEFIMIGLNQDNGKPLLRAYSVASPNWDDTLEFYSIKVADGPLTSKLQKIAVGDHVLLGKKPVGTLVLDALKPGKRLYMFSTGTGFAPFASLIRDPETYEKFDEVIVTHTCREVAELAYSSETVDGFLADADIGELGRGKLRLYQSCTREKFEHEGRITELMRAGTLFTDLDVPPLNPESDRAMICGSIDMTKELKALMEENGLKEGANSEPADFVIERAFVD
ncbi:MAG: ferredoxin--NADP reductase [Alphaproteobacteria bacterium]|nr:ferredoxin--NADP reductase [Alphaproteobacteria bacterium]